MRKWKPMSSMWSCAQTGVGPYAVRREQVEGAVGHAEHPVFAPMPHPDHDDLRDALADRVQVRDARRHREGHRTIHRPDHRIAAIRRDMVRRWQGDEDLVVAGRIRRPARGWAPPTTWRTGSGRAAEPVRRLAAARRPAHAPVLDRPARAQSSESGTTSAPPCALGPVARVSTTHRKLHSIRKVSHAKGLPAPAFGALFRDRRVPARRPAGGERRRRRHPAAGLRFRRPRLRVRGGPCPASTTRAARATFRSDRTVR